MTDEEARECFHKIGHGSYDVTSTQWFAMVDYLRSKFFDLNGLIESGEAIDRETL